ncbi:MAG: chemotaxis protein CheD [Solirubrobacteraceae bacterium]
MSQPEVIVRMGELAVSSEPNQVLTTLGLGSCIGLAMLDPSQGNVGLAHIMLPAAPNGHTHAPARFADTAVPALLAALARFGSAAASLEAVLIGGARMFAFARSAALNVGPCNEAAAREALGMAGIPIRAAATGGSIGRSVRVLAAEAAVTVRTASETTELYRAESAAAGLVLR